MSMKVDVLFGENKKIGASVGNHSIETDLPTSQGGDDSAPNPFELFLASLGACAGVYARKFFEQHSLETDGLKLALACEFREKKFELEKVVYNLTLPDGFPEKLVKPLVRSVSMCTVKQNVVNAPEFEVRVA